MLPFGPNPLKILISGQDWQGHIVVNAKVKACGRVNGYAWYLEYKSTSSSWLVEISEDQSIEPDDLPLVGFGISGWLYQCSAVKEVDCTNETRLVSAIQTKLADVFTLFKQNKLQHIRAVTCCND